MDTNITTMEADLLTQSKKQRTGGVNIPEVADTKLVGIRPLPKAKKPEPRLSRKALLETLDDRSNVQHFFQNRPYTCIVLMSWYNDKEYVGYGFSKVCYPDKWDDELGADIAKRRALYMVYHQVRADEKKAYLAQFPVLPNDGSVRVSHGHIYMDDNGKLIAK